VDAGTLRILDVNINRCREALRVIEDYARFARDDRDVAQRAKLARHELRAIVGACGPEALLAARDIAGDVGRDQKTESEHARDGTEAVVRAAFARLQEAARSLGENAKLVSREAAQRAEKLRYAAYELEQIVALRGAARQRFAAVRLYVLITEALCRRPWTAVAEAALRGGAGCLQLREKTLPDRELLRRARALRELTRRYGALLIVNDRPDIARLSAADGVHVGQDDLPVRDARRAGGADLLVGKSTHSAEQLRAALAESPDYVAVGPMFASVTKPGANVAGPAFARTAVELSTLPVVVIGGISAANSAAIRETGAGCVCVCSAVIGADEPESAAREILAAFVGANSPAPSVGDPATGG
jgi:thiamine-phosphate pyrophosphorylase